MSVNDIINANNKTIERITKPLIINDFIMDVHLNAIQHGWYETHRSFGEIISLMHSELSEAFEFERNKNNPCWLEGRIDYKHHYSGGGYVGTQPSEISNKPDGLLVELADVVLRVFDYVGSLDNVDFEQILLEKHLYNKQRPYKHGGKTI